MNVTHEETYKLLQEIANDPNLGDSFRVRVNFKTVPSAVPSVWAIFKNVPLEALLSPEPWLQQLSNNGRGVFEFMVSHESAVSKMLGGVLRFHFVNGNPDAKFTWSRFDQQDYRGPREVEFPLREEQQQAPQSQPFGGQVVAPSRAGEAAPRGVPEWAVPLLQKPSVDPMQSYLQMRREDERRQEEERKREREEARIREEREERRREAREKEEKDREERREAREREDRREQERRSQEYQQALFTMQQKQTEILMGMMNRTDPVRDALLQKAIQGSDEAGQKAAALIAQMGGFMSQMTGMTVQLLHTQAELQPQNTESPLWGIAGKLIDGYFSTVGSQQMELEQALAAPAEQQALPAGQAPAQEAEAPAQHVEQEGVEEQEEVSVQTPIQRLDAAIHGMAPLKELSDALCLALVTPEFAALYAQAKGDLRTLIIGRYGEWVKSAEVKDETQRKTVVAARMKYLSIELVKAWNVAKQRGIIREQPQAPKAPPHTLKTTRRRKEASPVTPAPAPAPVDGVTTSTDTADDASPA